jgi:hypothetical protein
MNVIGAGAMVRGSMSQRVIVIVLLALFTTCFVSSGAIITLKLIGGVVSSATAERPKRVVDLPPEPEESSPPALSEQDDPVTSVVPAEPPEPEDAVMPEDEPEDEPFEFQPPLIATGEFAVFHQDKAKLAPLAALQKAVKGTSVKVFESEAPASAIPPYVELRDLSTDDYAVIGGATLANGHGLSDAVKKALPNAKRVSVVDVYLPLGGQSLLEVSKVMLAFAHATGGVLWDEETNEYLSAEAWKTRRVDSWEKTVPNVSLSIKVYEDPFDEGTDLRTGGMKHFGLPELVLENVPNHLKDQSRSLLLAAAQSFAERKGPAAEGTLTVSLPRLKHVAFRKELERQTAANADRTLDLELVGRREAKLPTLILGVPPGGSEEQRLEAALDSLFGFEE